MWCCHCRGTPFHWALNFLDLQKCRVGDFNLHLYSAAQLFWVSWHQLLTVEWKVKFGLKLILYFHLFLGCATCISKMLSPTCRRFKRLCVLVEAIATWKTVPAVFAIATSHADVQRKRRSLYGNFLFVFLCLKNIPDYMTVSFSLFHKLIMKFYFQVKNEAAYLKEKVKILCIILLQKSVPTKYSASSAMQKTGAHTAIQQTWTGRFG